MFIYSLNGDRATQLNCMIIISLTGDRVNIYTDWDPNVLIQIDETFYETISQVDTIPLHNTKRIT